MQHCYCIVLNVALPNLDWWYYLMWSPIGICGVWSKPSPLCLSNIYLTHSFFLHYSHLHSYVWAGPSSLTEIKKVNKDHSLCGNIDHGDHYRMCRNVSWRQKTVRAEALGLSEIKRLVIIISFFQQAIMLGWTDFRAASTFLVKLSSMKGRATYILPLHGGLLSVAWFWALLLLCWFSVVSYAIQPKRGTAVWTEEEVDQMGNTFSTRVGSEETLIDRRNCDFAADFLVTWRSKWSQMEEWWKLLSVWCRAVSGNEHLGAH